MKSYPQSIVEYLELHASNIPGKTAVIAMDGSATYENLWKMTVGFSQILIKKGIRKGDPVVVKTTQTLSHIVAVLGIQLAGGLYTPLERSSSIETAVSILKKTVAPVFIGEKPLPDGYNTAKWLPLPDIRNGGRETRIPEIIDFPGQDDSADILFTTGTTGDAKGVELYHHNNTVMGENLCGALGIRDDTVLMLPGPLNHANPIRKVYTAIYKGATSVILDGMDFRTFFNGLENEGVNAISMTPAATRMLMLRAKEKFCRYGERIEFIESVSSPLPEADKQELLKLFPKSRLYNSYGSSEAGSQCTYNIQDHPEFIGCIGRPMPTIVLSVVDSDRIPIEESSERMPGFLACKGPINMKGYWNDPEATKSIMVNGYIYSKDLGYYKNGFVFMLGRESDIFDVGGFKVSPIDIENVALAYRGIEDCICVPKSNPISGYEPKLLIVVNERENLLLDDFRVHMMKTLESYKVPREIEIVKSINRTYNGKLDRKSYRI